MDKKVKTRWLEALRSGKYRKGKGVLRCSDGRMCCLGVLCDLLNVEWERGPVVWKIREGDDDRVAFLPRGIADTTGIHGSDEDELIFLNDQNDDWSEVIEYIEEKL